MTSFSEVSAIIQEKDIQFIDFRFTDTKGKWHHITQTVASVTEDTFIDGLMFDGSSISGWKEINESDMILMPDASSYIIDPFTAQPTLIIFCDVIEPETGQGYCRDPRSTAKRALAYMKSCNIGDKAFFGAEPEFFIFDDVKWSTSQESMGYCLDSQEGPYNSDTDFPEGNRGHRPGPKGGYVPVQPVDSAHDLRAEMVQYMNEMGVGCTKHHHEVAPSQHELGIEFNELLEHADQVQIYKYCVHMVAHQYGKTATFMPKPIFNDNGSGMHVHQSIWKGDTPVFAGNDYADLSKNALYYIGGIIKHAKSINAFTNPTTNSYKRLVPGFEAPVLLAYSARNRSASCRIPYTASPKGKRVEVRFPDACANPYLAFTALLMAGLDGIKNKIHPGDAMDKNLYDLPPQELQDIPTVSGSLKEALQALDQDRDFLKQNDVMSDDLIDSYIDLKMEEVLRLEQSPHPVEFDLYYSA